MYIVLKHIRKSFDRLEDVRRISLRGLHDVLTFNMLPPALQGLACSCAWLPDFFV